MVPMKILIVDDEAVMRELLSTILESYNHEAHTAESGAEAIRKLQDETFDLVITDLQMSPIDGFAVINHARQSSDELLIFLMTGCRDAQCAVDAYRLGADAFLTKPFSIDELVSHIQFHTIRLLASGQLGIERLAKPASLSG